jgi:hypothetical protein
VAHEEGNLNDLRGILGNDVAIKAYREGKLPFPDGTIIARLAWSYVPLEESEKAFGRLQSFAAGPPKNGVQFMVKDSRKYASTGGWGFAQSSRIDAAKEHVLVDRTSNRRDVRGPHVQEPIGIGLDAELAAILAAQLLAAFLLQSCCRVARLTWTSLQADHSERMLRD